MNQPTKNMTRNARLIAFLSQQAREEDSSGFTTNGRDLRVLVAMLQALPAIEASLEYADEQVGHWEACGENADGVAECRRKVNKATKALASITR